MTDRETLMALMREVDACICNLCDGGEEPFNHSAEILADHLLANGVVVREKGEWDDSGRYKFADGSKAIRCPFCGACINEEEYDLYVWNFCPYCGSDMRGEQ